MQPQNSTHIVQPEFPFSENIIEYAPWVAKYGLRYEYGKCQCGCDGDAPIAKARRPLTGIKQGEPMRFIHAHGGRVQVNPRKPFHEMFWDRINQQHGKCWEWTGPIDGHGYGIYHAHGENRVHRISYVIHNGPIPPNMLVCHRCDNPICTNPAHLFLGTTQDNTADMVAKRRHRFGELHNKAKLTDADIPRIRELRADGLSQQAIANQYGVSQTAISSILRSKTWNHVP